MVGIRLMASGAIRLALVLWVVVGFHGMAWAQTGYMIQGGAITRGHVPVAIQAGAPGAAVYGDGGPALNGNLSEIGITNTGTPLCINDVPPTNPGTGLSQGYHQLCFGSLALGGGLISYNAYGGAANLPLDCNVNGVTSPCIGGVATLTPPIVITDSKTAPITDQNNTLCAYSQPGITSQDIFDWTQGTFSGPTPTVYSVVCGVGVAPENSTTGIVAALGGFLQVDESTGVFPTGSVIFGAGAVTRDNGQIWGINIPLTDGKNASTPTTGAGRVLNNELDFQVTSPNTEIFGMNIQGNSIAQPRFAPNFNCGPLSLTPFFSGATMPAQWTSCFSTNDGASPVALSIGRLTNVNPAVHPQSALPSQPVAVGYTTPTNGTCNGIASCIPENVQISAVPGPSTGIGGGIKFTNTEGLITYLTSPGGVAIREGTNEVLNLAGPVDLPNGTSIFSINDANNALEDLEIDALNLSLRAQTLVTIVSPGVAIPTGTPASSSAACTAGQITFDSSFIYTCVATNTWRRAATSSF